MNNVFSTRIDITGKQFGKWTVLDYAYNAKGKQAHWKCQCECGTISVVTGRALRDGTSKSCGCYRGEIASKTHRIGHKLSDNAEYKRCSSCKSWISLNNFTKSKQEWDGLSDYCKNCQKKIRDSRVRDKEYYRNWANEKYKTDIHFRIKSSIQARIRSAVKNNYKSASTTILLGCSIKELKNYLERKFTKGMSWDNYGKWHIDHIIPCASFAQFL